MDYNRINYTRKDSAMPSEVEANYRAAWDELWSALKGVGDEESGAFRMDSWPRHEDWSGEDGSISGIVFHVAAWKHAYAEGLETGEWGDEKTVQPEDDSWAGRLAWLNEENDRLLSALRHLEEDEATSVLINDRPHTLPDIFLNSMAHHDVYHAAQVNYLRQRYAAHSS
jgi:uncharacterized damage-inducible protein DinB